MSTLLDRISLVALRARGFRSRYVGTSLGTTHVLDGTGRGSLPPLVLLHGVSSRGTHYRPMIRHLLPHHRRILLPDMLGHGLSDEPRMGLTSAIIEEALTETLDQLLDEPVVMFGNSMGGYMAIRYAARSPERVRGLAVNSPAGGALPDPKRALLLNRFDVRSHQDSLALVERAFARPPRPALRHMIAYAVRRQLAQPRMRRLFASITARDELSPEELQRLRMPTLFMWGQDERVLLEDQLDFFLAHLPAHARVLRPAGYGHSPYLERSRDLAQRLVDFAREALEPAELTADRSRSP
ncbi:MAG: alpha/beta hydrolase [Alphaproteobacteria bacterium]|nr:alpha/beta hydrolase [Alphaproteobacteria bacterium]